MLRITKPSIFPPGGYQYIQPETGMKFGGNTPFRPQCNAILAHRRANKLPRATLTEVAEDLINSTCERVPGICSTTSMNSTSAAVSMARIVRKCGTCGGRKAKA